ncbi:uncharacterized protein LOC128674997 isoform X2 [Plodia interpunctella]|uniref:uncharacterized protein LOC128674997 isoform X2 n=1 Tax=Plodia interpunctella TaxID=58824 RepID=UPI002367F894|nr:uncharacterized protein LOC128674997 isoform X2 [Plodia interpunctella]
MKTLSLIPLQLQLQQRETVLFSWLCSAGKAYKAAERRGPHYYRSPRAPHSCTGRLTFYLQRDALWILIVLVCDEQQQMMCGSLPLLLVALTTALAAPSSSFQDNSEKIIVPQKRAALVLDRLLIALQKALHEDSQVKESREWPRTEPLRIDLENGGDMSGLQRRGQGGGRGRVLRCYFNAVTCF